MSTREHHNLVKRIAVELAAPDTMVWVNNVLVAFTRAGVPTRSCPDGVSDLVGSVGGRFLALEAKTGKARLTEAQRAFLERVRVLGGVSAVVRNLEDAKFAVIRARDPRPLPSILGDEPRVRRAA